MYCTLSEEKSIELGPGCDTPSTHMAATMPSLPGTVSTRAWVQGLAQEVLFVIVNRGGNGQGNHWRTRNGGRLEETERQRRRERTAEKTEGRGQEAHRLLLVAEVDGMDLPPQSWRLPGEHRSRPPGAYAGPGSHQPGPTPYGEWQKLPRVPRQLCREGQT